MAGIGKSRLVSFLRDSSVAREATVIDYTCTNLARSTPLWPWRELFSQFSDPSDADNTLHFESHGSDSGQMSEARKFQLFTNVVAELREQSRDKTLVVVVDDLQWADSISQELFAFVASHIEHDSILLASGVRTADSNASPITNAVLSELGRLENYSRIEPTPLTSVEAHELVESLVGHSVTAEVVEQITERSSGIPLFIREMSQIVDHRGQFLAAELPEAISEILGSNFAKLSSGARSVLSAAAVLGGSFDAQEINTVLSETSMLDREQLSTRQYLSAIDEASKAGIIRSGVSGAIQFDHPLYADVALETVPSGERVLMHNQAALLLEQKHGPDSAAYASELAWHYGHATALAGTDKVVKYSLIAGQSAIRSFAWAEALELFENIRRIIGDTSQRIELAHAWLGIGRARHAAYQSKWGRSLTAAQIEEGLTTAFDLFIEHGETNLAIEAASQGIVGHAGWGPVSTMTERALDLAKDESSQTAKLLTRHADVLFNNPKRFEECWAVFDQAYEMAKMVDDKAVQLNILRIQAQFKKFENRHKDVIKLRDQSLPLIAALPHGTDSALMHINAGISEAALGDIDTGERSINIGQRIASQVGVELVLYHMAEINIQLARAKFSNAIDHAREALRLTEDVMTVDAFELVAKSYTGDVKSVLMTCRETLRKAEALPHKLTIQALFGNIAARIAHQIDEPESIQELSKISEALSQAPRTDPETATLTKQLSIKLAAASENPDTARDEFEKMDHFAGTFDMNAGGFPIDIYRGHLLKVFSDDEQALKAYSDAFKRTKNSGNILGEVEASYAYAAALIDRDNRVDIANAIEVLNHGISVAETHGFNSLLASMVKMLGSISSGKRIFPAGLTEREVDVVRLIVAGKSNPRIAEELFISLNTVLRHVSNIFGKLDVSNRTEAGIKAVEIGIVEKL